MFGFSQTSRDVTDVTDVTLRMFKAYEDEKKYARDPAIAFGEKREHRRQKWDTAYNPVGSTGNHTSPPLDPSRAIYPYGAQN